MSSEDSNSSSDLYSDLSELGSSFDSPSSPSHEDDKCKGCRGRGKITSTMETIELGSALVWDGSAFSGDGSVTSKSGSAFSGDGSVTSKSGSPPPKKIKSRSYEIDCSWCNGSGVSNNVRYDYFQSIWCRCEEPGESIYYDNGEHPDLEKHHYRCQDCNKVTQIG